jgi:hypothetical protein
MPKVLKMPRSVRFFSSVYLMPVSCVGVLVALFLVWVAISD